MRRILPLMLLPLPIAAAPPPPATAIGKGCTSHAATPAARPPGSAGFHRLDELPPANEILTVIHSVDGCEKPVIVRYGVDKAWHPSR